MPTTASAVAVKTPTAAMVANAMISFLRNVSPPGSTRSFSRRSGLFLALLGDRRLDRLTRREVEVALRLPGACTLLGRDDQRDLLPALLDRLLGRVRVDRAH